MLPLLSAFVAAVPPAAPLPIVRAADHHLDELKQRAREVEEAIKDLHRELEEIERAIEREASGSRGAARWIEDLGEEQGVFVVEMDGASGRQVMIDGERSELVERLVEELGEREGADGERMRRVLVELGEGEPLIDLGGDGAPGGVFVFETDGDEHHDDHHEGHHEEHHEAHHHDEMVREFEFPGGHGEIRVEVDVHGVEGEEILEPLLDQLMGAELPMISAFDAPDGVVILEHHEDHDGHEGELEEMLHELGIDLEDLHGHSVRHRMIRIGGEHGHHEEHHDEECEDDDGHHEDHHDEGSVHHFEFPGGHGEIHVGVEMHGDHGHDDHGHGGDLEEMLHELGIDLDGREMHIEMEVESEDEHGHHVEHRVIRIGGEHGHHEEHHEEECDGEECEDEECEEDDDHDHDGHHEGHDGHPDGVIVIGPGLDRRVRLRSNAPVPIEFDLEKLELGPGVVDLSRRADGPRRVRMQQRRSDPRERQEIMEQMRRRAMERQAQATRDGFPEEMQRAMRELQEEMRAMRREMNEMQRRLRQR